MSNEVLLSTAYFAPAVYFSILASSGTAVIEKCENYHKQTYRNRCVILGANGPLTLTVPVLRGSFHKTAIRDIELDNSRQWRKQHIKSIISAYALSPYFEYYFDSIEEAINTNASFLLDLNLSTTEAVNKCIGVKNKLRLSDEFMSPEDAPNDFRYCISPKIKEAITGYTEPVYIQAFSDRYGFVPGLSIIDMLFNNGPGTHALLQRSPDCKTDNCFG